MSKGKRLCPQTKTVLFGVYDYFDYRQQRGGGRGALNRESEPTSECSMRWEIVNIVTSFKLNS